MKSAAQILLCHEISKLYTVTCVSLVRIGFSDMNCVSSIYETDKPVKAFWEIPGVKERTTLIPQFTFATLK